MLRLVDEMRKAALDSLEKKGEIVYALVLEEIRKAAEKSLNSTFVTVYDEGWGGIRLVSCERLDEVIKMVVNKLQEDGFKAESRSEKYEDVWSHEGDTCCDTKKRCGIQVEW